MTALNRVKNAGKLATAAPVFPSVGAGSSAIVKASIDDFGLAHCRQGVGEPLAGFAPCVSFMRHRPKSVFPPKNGTYCLSAGVLGDRCVEYFLQHWCPALTH